MQTEIPYMLYLNFIEPIEEDNILGILEAAGLIKDNEELIDPDFKTIKFHFQSDSNKRMTLNVVTNPLKKNCENINIAISMDTSIDTIKEVFAFISNFKESNVILIDQEVKNELFKKNLSSFTTEQQTLNIPNSWINKTEEQANLSLSFEDFHNNPLQLTKRDKLLHK